MRPVTFFRLWWAGIAWLIVMLNAASFATERPTAGCSTRKVQSEFPPAVFEQIEKWPAPAEQQ